MSEFADAVAQIDEWIGPHGVPGAGVVVRFRGEMVAERYAGEQRTGVPVNERTLFALASVTKPVTAAALMSCIDDGLLSLDDRVSRYLPDFAEPGDPSVEWFKPELEQLRGEITLRQLLCHCAGLSEDFPGSYFDIHRKPTLAEFTDAYERLPLRDAPGTMLRYSNTGYALIARMVEHVTRNEFWSEVSHRLLEPLGEADLVARPGAELADRLTTVAGVPGGDARVQFYNSTYFHQLAIPWGGMYGSPRALAAFADAFMPGRERVLSVPSAQAMITDQVRGLPGEVGAMRLHWERAWWGLGWEVRGEKRNHWTGNLASPETFCHFGAAGTLLWADPARDLVVAVFANRMTLNVWPFRPPRWTRLNDALVAAADGA